MLAGIVLLLQLLGTPWHSEPGSSRGCNSYELGSYSWISVGCCFVAEIAALNHLPTLRHKKQKGKAAEVGTCSPGSASLDTGETLEVRELGLGRVFLNAEFLRTM